MPNVRIERVPVQSFGLGLLGFDHLQIVYERAPSPQERWFVIEGLREVGPHGLPALSVEGWEGATTLSEANGGRTGEALTAAIGTHETRGSRVLASGPDAISTWAKMSSSAAAIHQEQFPYLPAHLSSSPLPTINSSSLVASLLSEAGYDPREALPIGVRFTPGLSTRLGSGRDDTMRATEHATTLVAGGGQDDLAGTQRLDLADKLFGGRGDDVLHWSCGDNVLHGGQPTLDYALDGTDTVDYSGAGVVEIDAAPAPVAHLRPDFVARTGCGVDRLFSVEVLTWDKGHDHILVGQGAALLGRPLKLKLGGGDDVLDASGAAFALAADAGPGRDHIIAGRGPLSVLGGPGADLFEVSQAGGVLTIRDAAPEDRLAVSETFTQWRVDWDEGPDPALVLHLATREPGIETTIHIDNFEDGDLGLSLVPIDASQGDGEAGARVLLKDHAGALSAASWSGPDHGP